MQLPGKVILNIVVCMSITQVMHTEIIKIEAYTAAGYTPTKIFPTIRIYQGGHLISAARFKGKTGKSETLFNTNNSEKSLFVDTSKGEVTVDVCPVSTKDKSDLSSGCFSKVKGKEDIDQSVKRQFPIEQFSQGTQIEIGRLKDTGEYTITLKKPSKLSKFIGKLTDKSTTMKVKVIKTDPDSYKQKWQIMSVKDYVAVPQEKDLYDEVILTKETNRKLIIPKNQEFWIIVSKTTDNILGSELVRKKFMAGEIKGNATIEIDGQGNAAIKK